MIGRRPSASQLKKAKLKEIPMWAPVRPGVKKVGSAIAKGLKAIPSKRGHGALKRK